MRHEYLYHVEVWNSETESTEVIDDLAVGTSEENVRSFLEGRLDQVYPENSQLLELTLVEVERGTVRD